MTEPLDDATAPAPARTAPEGERAGRITGMTARRPATLTEVAQRAGVSLTTASKAINGRARVSEETRARVLKAARELSFIPNPMARSLISGRSGTVGLIIVDSLSQRFAVPILLGAEAALSEVDLSMIVTDARGDAGRLSTIIDTLRGRKVDGVIVLGDNNVDSPSIGSRLHLPVTYVYGDTGSARDIVHVPDDLDSGRIAIEHLLQRGRSRIAIMMGPAGTRAVDLRTQGALQVLAEHGLAPAAPVVCGPWSQLWARGAALDLLDRAPGVDAVLCGSDQLAAGVVSALGERGRRIPQDVALVGFDNWAIFALESEPALTTIDLNLEDLGAATVRDLFGVIDGAPVGAGVRLHPGTLVARASSAG